jgi:hypothetical protein
VLAIPEVEGGCILDPGENAEEPFLAENASASEHEYVWSREHAMRLGQGRRCM